MLFRPLLSLLCLICAVGAIPTHELVDRNLEKRINPSLAKFNRNLPGAPEQMMRFLHAWTEVVLMMKIVHNQPDKELYNKVFAKWFNSGDLLYVEGVFSRLVGAENQADPGKPTGSDLPRHIKLVNEEHVDFPNDCVDKTVGAFIRSSDDGNSALLRICDLGWAQPLISELDCDRVGDNVSALMNTLPALIIHELTHWRQIGEPIIGAKIVDHGAAGYGPLNCRKIVGTSIAPVVNADSYAWFANEYYWSISCKKEYKDPTTNRNYGICPVDEDATGGAGCTVQ